MHHRNGRVDHALAQLPDWVPSAEEEVQSRKCHRWWDAVEIPCVDSIYVFARLGTEAGPVVGDQRAGLHWWLVPPSAADDWTLPGIKILGDGDELRVPPAEAPCGALLWWASPPTSPLTDPQRLHAVLNAVTTTAPGRTRSYLSPECGVGQHAACRHGVVAKPGPHDYGVRAEACTCTCHEPATRGTR